jgi:sugar phosphate isomerase/epimerase
MGMIAVSTCAFRGKSVREVDEIATKNGFIIEFSSGFPYEPGLENKFLAARCRKLIHNYFPTPARPFVLNLASLNKDNWNRSLIHAQKAMRLARRGGATFYSIHAGFCMEPKPKELGHDLTHHKLQKPRPIYWKRFIQGLSILLKDADQLHMDLLVENNVISQENRSVALLCADPQETQRLFTELPHPRLGLIVDTGHLKVSARTLGFSVDRFIKVLAQRIRGFHHSDNDGISDTNRPLTRAYWFLEYMPRFSHATHILEIDHLSTREIQAQINLLRKALA